MSAAKLAGVSTDSEQLLIAAVNVTGIFNLPVGCRCVNGQ